MPGRLGAGPEPGAALLRHVQLPSGGRADHLPVFFVDQDMGGVMYQNSEIRLTDITDGTSQTLAVGECIFDAKTGKRACIWPGMTGLRSGRSGSVT